MTLVELITVLAILGIMAGIVGAAFIDAEPVAPTGIALAHASVADARRQAITTGLPVTIALTVGDELGPAHAPDSFSVAPTGNARTRFYRATAIPDGSVLADSALGIERLSGRPLTRSEGR
jgi:prepilin-type N-terminal cleavage/methylation domain-containing protein